MLLRTTQTDKINRITLFSDFNYAFRNYYDDDFYYEPKETGTHKNSCIQFISNSKGCAIVDWGDGKVEQVKFVERTDNTFICAWRSLKIDYYKHPGVYGWNLGKEKSTNENIIPYENHEYKDNNKQHSITINFTNQIITFNMSFIVTNQFPLMELPSLTSLTIRYARNIKEVPINRISNLKALETLHLSLLDNETNSITYIPDSIFGLSELKTLNWDGGLNLSNIEGSNIRKIKNLKKLTTVSLRQCMLSYYLKEFNDLPLLKSLSVGNADYVPESPMYDEVLKIHQELRIYSFLVSAENSTGSRTNWAEQTAGKGVENITQLTARHGRMLPLQLPSYIQEMRSLEIFDMSSSLHNQERIDTFVNNLYEYILSWEHINMKDEAEDKERNQFYSLKVNTYDPTYPGYACIPSGVYQAPAGFKKGVENGNPDNPMEKIYVLVNNYAQSWTLKPADVVGVSTLSYSIPQLEYNQIINDTMIYSPQGIYQKNEVKTLTDEELEKINYMSKT